MAEVKWIQITTDIFENRKIKQIEVLPEGDTIIVIWFKLLALAGNINDNGLVYFTKDLPYTDQMLATYFNRPLTTVQLALDIFQKFEMINITDNLLEVSNWEKYQNVEGLERIREQTRKRVAKHRELKKLECNVTCNATVTQSNAIDIDKEKDIDKKDIYCVDFEKAWSAYPRKTEKKKAYGCYKARLKEGYSEAELLQATQKYADECKKQNREQKYIKLAATFWGVNTPFVDYLDKKPDNGLEYEEGALVYPIDYTNPTPPCYGLPAGWFDGDVLVKERMTPIKQPANKQMGLYNPVYYDVKAIMEMYNMRREWFEHNG